MPDAKGPLGILDFTESQKAFIALAAAVTDAVNAIRSNGLAIQGQVASVQISVLISIPKGGVR